MIWRINSAPFQIKEFEDDMEKRTRRLHTQLEELTDLVDSLEIDRFFKYYLFNLSYICFTYSRYFHFVLIVLT